MMSDHMIHVLVSYLCLTFAFRYIFTDASFTIKYDNWATILFGQGKIS